jgi:uncharacterized protein YbjT (DUF2867 family)
MILVTGGTGFVGGRVVHALRARSEDVRCLVRSAARAHRLGAWGCELVEGDVGDAETLARAVDGADAVVHLVSIIAGRPADFERTMTHATEALVGAARTAEVRRIVLMSALGTSEATKDLVPYYGAKWAMEQAVAGSGLEYVVLRPSFVFGRDGGALAQFLRIVHLLPVTPVVGSGTQRLQPIWVEDLAEITAEAVHRPGVAGRTFELGGPDVVDWNELYARIARRLGKRRPQLHVPFAVMRAQALLLERLPSPPVTRDQLAMLAAGDNVCDIRAAVEAFGIDPIGLDDQLRRAIA